MDSETNRELDQSTGESHNIPLRPRNPIPAPPISKNLPIRPHRPIPAPPTSQTLPIRSHLPASVPATSQTFPIRSGLPTSVPVTRRNLPIRPHNPIPAPPTSRTIPIRPRRPIPSPPTSRTIPLRPLRPIPLPAKRQTIPLRPHSRTTVPKRSRTIPLRPLRPIPVPATRQTIPLRPRMPKTVPKKSRTIPFRPHHSTLVPADVSAAAPPADPPAVTASSISDSDTLMPDTSSSSGASSFFGNPFVPNSLPLPPPAPDSIPDPDHPAELIPTGVYFKSTGPTPSTSPASSAVIEPEPPVPELDIPPVIPEAETTATDADTEIPDAVALDPALSAVIGPEPPVPELDIPPVIPEAETTATNADTELPGATALDPASSAVIGPEPPLPELDFDPTREFSQDWADDFAADGDSDFDFDFDPALEGSPLFPEAITTDADTELPSSAALGLASSAAIEPASSPLDTAPIDPESSIMAATSGKPSGSNTEKPKEKPKDKSKEQKKVPRVPQHITQEAQEHTRAIIQKTTLEGTEFAYKSNPVNAPALKAKSVHFPNLPPAIIEVIQGDTFDVAIKMTNGEYNAGTEDFMPVCVLNHANATHSGGGWLRGSHAQEEQLFYRSTLSGSLRFRFYPMDTLDCMYSPHVIIFRESEAANYKLLADINTPEKLPFVSVLSMAAEKNPALVKNKEGKKVYTNDADRGLMYDKMRQVLRTAALHNHRRLVLGALGCGAFGHPVEEVATLWRDLLDEKEFDGWFEHIIFAIYDYDPKKNNVDTFKTIIEGPAEDPVDPAS